MHHGRYNVGYGARREAPEASFVNVLEVKEVLEEVRALMNLLVWWDSLGEVEKASKEQIR